MFTKISRLQSRTARSRRIRAIVSGTAARPRLAVYRSLTHISAQLIDDVAGVTLAAASDKGLTGTPTVRAAEVGKALATAAKAKKISAVVFDRAGFKYHGRVAALASSARENGLVF